MRKLIFFNLNRVTYEGGAENYLIDLGNRFQENGKKVFYLGDFRFFLKIFIFIGFILRNISFSECCKLINNISTHPVTDPKRIKFSVRNLNWKIFIPFSKLRRELKKIIKSSESMFIKNELIDMLFFQLFIPKTRKKYCIIFTSLYYPQKETLRAKVHNFFYLGWIYKFLLKQYNGLIVSNKFDQELLINHFGIKPDSIHYIPYGIDFERFQKEKELLTIPHFISGKKNVLFVGRLEEQKGIGDFLEIIQELNKIENNYQFIIIGGGPLKAQVISTKNKYKNVFYLGAQSHAKVLSIYEIADVVVIPSKWETFCYVALEAQLSGKPVICYDVSGPNEIILDGFSGKIIHGNWRDVLMNLDNEYHVDTNYFIKKFSLEEVLKKYKVILDQA